MPITSCRARTAQQLLVDLQQAKVERPLRHGRGTADLGIPRFPARAGDDDTSLTSADLGHPHPAGLVLGPGQARLAMLGTSASTDIIRNGPTSGTGPARTTPRPTRTLTADEQTAGAISPTSTEYAEARRRRRPQVLARSTPTTKVTSDSAVECRRARRVRAGADPEGPGTSLIGQVRIAIDGEKKVPLRVQVIGDRATRSVFEVGFTQVDFTRPDDADFTFNPPPGAKVTEIKPSDQKTPSAQDRQKAEEADGKATKVVGTGWTAVIVPRSAPCRTAKLISSSRRSSNKLQPVHGTWGTGRLLAGTAFSAVITDDGRLAIGAVHPDVLYTALEQAEFRPWPTRCAVATRRAHQAVPTPLLSTRRPGGAGRRGLRLPGPERLRQDHHDPDAAWADPADGR